MESSQKLSPKSLKMTAGVFFMFIGLVVGGLNAINNPSGHGVWIIALFCGCGAASILLAFNDANQPAAVAAADPVSAAKTFDARAADSWSVSPEGLKCTDRGLERDIPWDEVKETYHHLDNFTLVTTRDDLFKIDSLIPNRVELGEEILKVLTPRVIRLTEQALRNGQAAKFGPVTLSPMEITIGGRAINWLDMDSFRTVPGPQGHMLLELIPREKPSLLDDPLGYRPHGYTVRLSEIPNWPALHQILKAWQEKLA